MKDSVFCEKLRAAGLKSASTFEKAQRDFFYLFVVVAVLMAFLTTLAADNYFAGVPFWKTELILGMASVLLFFHVVNLAFFLWWSMIVMSQTFFGTMYAFFKWPSTIYTALMFSFAITLYHQSWLYKPFLVVSFLMTMFILYTSLPSIRAALLGGGQGLSEDEMK